MSDREVLRPEIGPAPANRHAASGIEQLRERAIRTPRLTSRSDQWVECMIAALFGNTCSWPQTSGYYWQQSRRPLTCLAFVAPLLVLYEGGVLWLGPQAMRNGADVWLRQLLDLLGFGQYFLLPLLTVAILLGWHHTTAQKWQVVPGVLYAMFAECLLLGLALVVIARLQGRCCRCFCRHSPIGRCRRRSGRRSAQPANSSPSSAREFMKKCCFA